MSGRGDVESTMQQSTTAPTAARPAVRQTDPAVQIVESAYQIVTMIGANPRAIRPILAQRRLTKEQVLEAAASVGARAGARLAELDAAESERRAAHEATVLELKDRIEAWQAETQTGAAQQDEASAELTQLQAELETADAAFAHFEAEQQRPRTFLTGLRERAARVAEVYQAL